MKKTKELLGGQALIEGVMMKGSKALGYAVYNPQKQLIESRVEFIPLIKRYPIAGTMFIRGFINLMEMMYIGMKSIVYSTEIAMPDEAAKQSKYEMPLSIMISLLFSFGLFIFLPASAFTYLKPYIANTLYLNIIEGLFRITIFVFFLTLVSFSKDMARVFGFHGAEHMVVHAYEAEEVLTVENVRKYSTIHPRCGTSFLLVVFMVSVIVFAFLGRPDLLQRIMYKVLLLPFIAGVSYEIIRSVCRLPHWLMVLILWPGLLMQKVTTRQPDDEMLKAAIAALQQARGEI